MLDRVKDKLTGIVAPCIGKSCILTKYILGRDFRLGEALLVPEQVDKLLQQATSLEVSTNMPSIIV